MPGNDERRGGPTAEGWAQVYARLAATGREGALAPGDLERLATAAYLTGRDEESADAWTRAHRAFLERGDPRRAARSAFWLAFQLVSRGERARGGGWFARARRLVEEHGDDCVERGYLLVPEALGALAGGDAAAARDTFTRAAETGERFDDPDLRTLGRLGCGQALIRLGDIAAGVALLDETIVAVETQELSPLAVGTVYCAVIETCQEIYDLRRAQEWTAALTRWCEAQPDLVPFRGQCLVRRAELMQLRGAWPEALAEAERAGEWLARPPGEPAAGLAFYRQAELHRLRGEFEQAEAAYREASRWGRTPQPGLALLRLAQGQADAAAAASRRLVEEARTAHERTDALAAHVEIMLAAGEVGTARAAAQQLEDVAERLDARLPRALAGRALGAVRLADGDAAGALETLRPAWRRWEEIDAPYEAARTRVLIGAACEALGDADTAALERDAARRTFERLGAAPDLERLSARQRRAGPPGGLSDRELEVLRLVAGGATNRAVAGELSISERTVERHLSNIYVKLGVSSRTAAAAWAYEHHVI